MSQNQFHSLTVASVARNTRDAVVVTFDLPETLAQEFAFQPGQYLTLRTELNGQEQRRSYSICSAPDDKLLRVAIKKVDEASSPAGPTMSCSPARPWKSWRRPATSPSIFPPRTSATMWRLP